MEINSCLIWTQLCVRDRAAEIRLKKVGQTQESGKTKGESLPCLVEKCGYYSNIPLLYARYLRDGTPTIHPFHILGSLSFLATTLGGFHAACPSATIPETMEPGNYRPKPLRPVLLLSGCC